MHDLTSWKKVACRDAIGIKNIVSNGKTSLLDLDQLRSFDDVMAGGHATLNLKRGMALHHDREPDENYKTFLEDLTDLKDLTDLYNASYPLQMPLHSSLSVLSEKMMLFLSV
jgi:hypothetical protein